MGANTPPVPNNQAKTDEGVRPADSSSAPPEDRRHSSGTSNRLSTGNEDADPEDANSTIHAFNLSNVTVIERLTEDTSLSHQELLGLGVPCSEEGRRVSCEKLTSLPCDGSDSGVEVIESFAYRRTLSANSGASQDLGSLTPARSCDSSILSCCSNYEEAYNILVRRNSTLLEDYTFRREAANSEHGSESSSVTGSSSSRNSKRTCQAGPKKKADGAKTKTTAPRKPPVTPRLRSVDRAQARTNASSRANAAKKTATTPNTLELKNPANRRESKTRPSSARTSSTTRTPTATPTDDGRWPSINSRPAPLMSRSLRGMLDTPVTKSSKTSQVETKTIEKYATLPRRRKEAPNDAPKDVVREREAQKKPTSRESSVNRAVTMPKKPSSRESLPASKLLLSQMKKRQKVKIYHEANVQTTLNLSDMDKVFSGVTLENIRLDKVEKCDREVQVDFRAKDLEFCRDQLRLLTLKYEALNEEHRTQTVTLKRTEERLMEEQVVKEGMHEELKRNRERVLAILGEENNSSDGEAAQSDSLMVLESRYHNVSQVVIRQEEEISKLNAMCRSLHLELEKALAVQVQLQVQYRELETESGELQDFMQAEKTTLQDALKEAEADAERLNQTLGRKEQELREKQEECKHLVRLSEQRRQENLGLQARLGALEAKSRELLVHQGSSVSGASVALSALIGRLDGLVEELVSSYSISEQELEDIIFHNEAYSNSSSSPDATPEKMKKLYMDRTPSPKRGSSFVSAVINAIKNAAAQSPFAALKDTSKDELCTEHSSSNEMLDSETEPCLMMENVLEDVVVPDGHSHNMISSGHGLLNSRLTHSESLKDLSQAILNRQMSEQMSVSYAGSLTASFTSDIVSFSEIFPSISLIDQVIDVDNLITRLLKVIRIIQLENDDSMNELQEQRDSLAEQVDKQKETNKVVVKQLKDWELLGARLKAEVKELMQQLSKKNAEIDKIKTELNNQREQVEKLNQDVCELSTALAKAELEMKTKEEEVTEAIKKWEKSGESPTPEVLEKLIVSHNEVPTMKERLAEKERHLNELTQEFLASRQVLTESLKDAVSEAKKQYQALDNALEVLHSIQSVVQQCQPLAQLQRDLEETSFKSASKMPLSGHPDCNANAGLLQAVTNLEIASPINTTA